MHPAQDCSLRINGDTGARGSRQWTLPPAQPCASVAARNFGRKIWRVPAGVSSTEPWPAREWERPLTLTHLCSAEDDMNCTKKGAVGLDRTLGWGSSEGIRTRLFVRCCLVGLTRSLYAKVVLFLLITHTVGWLGVAGYFYGSVSVSS